MARTPQFKIAKRTEDLISQLRKPPIIPETGWWRIGASQPLGIEFQGGWGNSVNASLNFAPLRFYISEDGEVRIHGNIEGGGPGTVICRLPVEARPQFPETFICPLSDGEGHATIRIDVNGDMVLVNLVEN